MAPFSVNKIGVLDVSMHALAAYKVATVVEVSMSLALSWSQARDTVLSLGYLLPTCDELKVARVLGSVAHNPGYTNDMWMPVRRLDGVEGDWCEIGTNHGGPYVSHLDYFGNIGESWSATNDYNVWRPTRMMYAVRGEIVSEGLGALISPFYNELFAAHFPISTTTVALPIWTGVQRGVAWSCHVESGRMCTSHVGRACVVLDRRHLWCAAYPGSIMLIFALTDSVRVQALAKLLLLPAQESSCSALQAPQPSRSVHHKRSGVSPPQC